MGLDQYAYTVNKHGEKETICEWRKHPNLHGWMENLWRSQGNEDGDFNCEELELTEDDLLDLEDDVCLGMLPKTTGFFFGEDSDLYYEKTDLKFIETAKEKLKNGYKVFYYSWW